MPRPPKFLLSAPALALALWLAPPAARAQGPADDFERGKQLLARGDAKGAAEVLGRAAEGRKTDADAWHNLGLALDASGKEKEARAAFEKAVRLRPDSAETRVSLAAVLLRLGKTRDAEREAARAVALDANSPAARYIAGAAQARSGNYARAAQEAEEALRLQADFPAAARLLGDALLSLYVGESARAEAQYPLPEDADEETRAPVFEKREAALAPLKARMREAADRLEAPAAGLAPGEARELADTLRVYGSGPGGGPARAYRQSQVTTKATIIDRPEPAYSVESRRGNFRGVVRLRAVLGSDGAVRNIIVIKGLPDGLTGKAIEAARRIRFQPATVDGRPVSQFVILEYTFDVY